MALIRKVDTAHLGIEAAALQLIQHFGQVFHQLRIPILGLQRFADQKGAGVHALHGNEAGKLLLIGLAQHLAAVVNGPQLVPQHQIGQGLALRHGYYYLIWQTSFNGDLLNIGELCKNTAQGSKAVKEEQVVPFLNVNGPDDLLIGIVAVPLHLDIGDTEKDAHHEYGSHDYQKEHYGTAEAAEVLGDAHTLRAVSGLSLVNSSCHWPILSS